MSLVAIGEATSHLADRDKDARVLDLDVASLQRQPVHSASISLMNLARDRRRHLLLRVPLRSVLRRVEITAILELLHRVAQRRLAVHAVAVLLAHGHDLPTVARLVARKLQLASAARVVGHQLSLAVGRRIVKVRVLLVDGHNLGLLGL